MAHIAKGSFLVRVGAALSTLVVLGVSGLAYLFVTDAYDTYPHLGYRAVFTVLGVLIPLPLAFFFGLITVRIHTSIATPADDMRSEMHVGLLRSLPAHLVA